MKSKEAIRNEIIHNTKLIWGPKNIDRMDPLVRLLIEVLSNELYVLQNNISDVNMMLLKKTASLLTPDSYISTRPSHAIMKITPTIPLFEIDKNNEFYLKDIPVYLQNKEIETIIFCPVTHVTLTDVKISGIFHKNTLWSLNNNTGDKVPIAYSSEEKDYNTIWIGLDINKKVKDLKNLYFYFNFYDLEETHEYYDILSYTKWFTSRKTISVKKGLPKLSEQLANNFDDNIIRFYEDRYLHISNFIQTEDLPLEPVPAEIAESFSRESFASVPPKHWIKIIFPPSFNPYDLDKVQITLNSFPVSNKRICVQRFTRHTLNGIPILPAGKEEKFLDIDLIRDMENNIYTDSKSEHYSKEGTYTVKNTTSSANGEFMAFDYLERLTDIIYEERIQLPSINAEKLNNTMIELKNLQKEISKKMLHNQKNRRDNIAKIQINPYEETSIAHVQYWVTHGELMNGISKGSVFMAHKNSPLNKDNTVFLTTSCGGKEFSETTDILAINKYVLISGDRILTASNIIDFCRSELGKLVKNVVVKKGTAISSKPKEGIISVIYVYITPYNYKEFIKIKGVLKELKTRLKQRSPRNYNYKLIINHEIGQIETAHD